MTPEVTVHAMRRYLERVERHVTADAADPVEVDRILAMTGRTRADLVVQMVTPTALLAVRAGAKRVRIGNTILVCENNVIVTVHTDRKRGAKIMRLNYNRKSNRNRNGRHIARG